jgi:hypothetical protein
MAIGAATAHAASTRAEWVAQVDPICEAAQLQEGLASAQLAPLARRVKQHKGDRKTLRKFGRAFNSFLQQTIAIERGVNSQIAAIPPAPDDVSLVQVWLRVRGELLDSEGQLFGGPKPGKGLKGFGRFFSSLFQLIGREYETTDLVRDFGFQFCARPSSAELQFLG